MRKTQFLGSIILGKRIRTRREWHDAREGTVGLVSRVEQSASRYGWIVGITWDWQHQPEPLQEWFDRGEYER